jgi:hypothetical protein
MCDNLLFCTLHIYCTRADLVVPAVATADSTDGASPTTAAAVTTNAQPQQQQVMSSHTSAQHSATSAATSAAAAAAAAAAAEMPALLRLGNERSALLRSNARHLEVQLAEAEGRCRDLTEVITAATATVTAHFSLQNYTCSAYVC